MGKRKAKVGATIKKVYFFYLRCGGKRLWQVCISVILKTLDHFCSCSHPPVFTPLFFLSCSHLIVLIPLFSPPCFHSLVLTPLFSPPCSHPLFSPTCSQPHVLIPLVLTSLFSPLVLTLLFSPPYSHSFVLTPLFSPLCSYPPCSHSLVFTPLFSPPCSHPLYKWTPLALLHIIALASTLGWILLLSLGLLVSYSLSDSSSPICPLDILYLCQFSLILSLISLVMSFTSKFSDQKMVFGSQIQKLQCLLEHYLPKISIPILLRKFWSSAPH